VAALAAPAGQGQVALGPVDDLGRAVRVVLAGTEVPEGRGAKDQAVSGRAALGLETALVARRVCEVAAMREAEKILPISPESASAPQLAVDLQVPRAQMPEWEIPMGLQQAPRDREEARMELK
jgi:hypothetical protein